jgi:hypothetical protein
VLFFLVYSKDALQNVKLVEGGVSFFNVVFKFAIYFFLKYVVNIWQILVEYHGGKTFNDNFYTT